MRKKYNSQKKYRYWYNHSKNLIFQCECRSRYTTFSGIYYHIQKVHGWRISTRFNSSECKVFREREKIIYKYILEEKPESDMPQNILEMEAEVESESEELDYLCPFKSAGKTVRIIEKKNLPQIQLQIMRTVKDPFILKIHSISQDQDFYNITMDYFETNFRIYFDSYQERTTKFTKEILDAVERVLHGLIKLEAYGYVHGDIRGQNILCNPISDFCLSNFTHSHIITEKQKKLDMAHLLRLILQYHSHLTQKSRKDTLQQQKTLQLQAAKYSGNQFIKALCQYFWSNRFDFTYETFILMLWQFQEQQQQPRIRVEIQSANQNDVKIEEIIEEKPKKPFSAKAIRARNKLRITKGMRRSQMCKICQTKYNAASKYQVKKHKHLN